MILKIQFRSKKDLKNVNMFLTCMNFFFYFPFQTTCIILDRFIFLPYLIFTTLNESRYGHTSFIFIHGFHRINPAYV